MPIKFHYVYILHSLKDGLFYIGYTEDLKQRVYDHNMGKTVSTKNRRPLELIFYEAYPNKGSPPQAAGYYCRDITTFRGKPRGIEPFLAPRLAK